MSDAPLTVDTLLERVQREGVRRTATALRKPPVPSRLLQELAERVDVPEARQFVAAYPLSPSHLLETLAQAAPDPVVLGLLATNPRTPPHLLTQLAAHTEASVRAQAAVHPQIPPRELLTLADDPQREVRRSLASNPSLRLPHQALLSADADPGVRLKLAGQGNLPKPVALVLAADASSLVRVHTVASAKVEEDVLLGWAAGDEEDIQLALARREDLTPAAHRILIQSPHATVRRAIRALAKLDDIDLLHLARHGEPEERAWVAARDLLVRPLQNLLAQDSALEVRVALAGNVSLDEEIIRYFVGQAEAPVCAALAINPVVPLDLVQELAATRHASVLAALAYREVLEADLVRFLLAHSPDFRGHWAQQQRPINDIDLETAKLLRADNLPSVRALAVAGCRDWRLADLYEIARDPAAVVRFAAMRHPRASDELLAERANDPVPELAAAALQLRETRQRAAASALRSQATATPARQVAAAPTRPADPTTAAIPQAPAPELRAPISDLRTAPPLSAAPAPRFVKGSSPGLFNKLKRIFF